MFFAACQLSLNLSGLLSIQIGRNLGGLDYVMSSKMEHLHERQYVLFPFVRHVLTIHNYVFM